MGDMDVVESPSEREQLIDRYFGAGSENAPWRDPDRLYAQPTTRMRACPTLTPAARRKKISQIAGARTPGQIKKAVRTLLCAEGDKAHSLIAKLERQTKARALADAKAKKAAAATEQKLGVFDELAQSLDMQRCELHGVFASHRAARAGLEEDKAAPIPTSSDASPPPPLPAEAYMCMCCAGKCSGNGALPGCDDCLCAWLTRVAAGLFAQAFADPFLGRTHRGMRDNAIFSDLVDEAGWRHNLNLRCHRKQSPGFFLIGQASYLYRFGYQFGELITSCTNFYLALYEVFKAHRGTPAAISADELRRKWLRKKAFDLWAATVPAGVAYQLFLRVEAGLFRVFMRRMAPATLPVWDQPPPSSMIGAAAEAKCYYVLGWALFSVTRKVVRRSHSPAATPTDMCLRTTVSLLRHYPSLNNLPAAETLGHVETVERSAGALYRCTDVAFNFGLHHERCAHHWLTYERLVAFGQEFPSVVLDHLVGDPVLTKLFRACLPDTLPQMLEVTPEEADGIVQQLQWMVSKKLMSSRTKYFSQEANDRLRERLNQLQATRPRLLAKATAAEKKASKLRERAEKKVVAD